jgi:multicomponent Na+:H+ antiporter subunit C
VNLLTAAVVGVLFGSGVFLLLKPDLLRVVAGLVLISNAANLTLMGSGLARGQAPILPPTGTAPVSDPLAQAMTLTALVIGFAVTALLLSLVVVLHRRRHSLDFDELSHQEMEAAQRDEAEELAHDEWREPAEHAEPDEEHEGART